MRALRTALNRFTNDANLSESIAFDLVEVYSELAQVKSLIEAMGRNRRPTKKQLRSITSILVYHWPYHLRSLKRTLPKLLPSS